MLQEADEGEKILEIAVMLVISEKLYSSWPLNRDVEFMKQKLEPVFRAVYNGTSLQYCCPENPMDGGAWQAAVHGVAKSQT